MTCQCVLLCVCIRARVGLETTPPLTTSHIAQQTKVVMLHRFFILPARFGLNEIEELTRLIQEAVCVDNDFEITECAAEANTIITKLVQIKRLERELRCLHLAGDVVVFKALECERLLSSPVALDCQRAWCVYSPHKSEGKPGAIVNLTHQDPSQSLTTVDVSTDTGYQEDMSEPTTTEVGSTCAPKHTIVTPASLLRRESSADPSSHVYNRRLPFSNSGEKYACQRWTPSVYKNAGLISNFESLKLARILQGDHVGERAYSIASASLKAYDRELVSANETLVLEGFGKKFVAMTDEYLRTGAIQEASITWASDELIILQTFWKCHGVGAVTAREWYFERGYRDLNDAIQDWSQLSRPIQIGLKHYTDFLCTISREEVREIADKVATHAQQIATESGSNSAVSHIVCGGFRRGKNESGDVDILLSHETCHSLENMLMPLLQRLETLSFVETIISTQTDQEQIGDVKFGTSIALVVVVMPSLISGKQIRRRLDIIVCHPRSYATAILGWTGSTTLERDLRRYTSKVKRWKFESSGLRDEATGDLISTDECNWTPGVDLTSLEQNLFRLLDLEWIPPEFRCA